MHEVLSRSLFHDSGDEGAFIGDLDDLNVDGEDGDE